MYKPCVVCAESIQAAAKKCIKCGAYQDWRRHLEHTQPWVLWLVAVLTAVFAAITSVSKFVHTPDSNLELSSPSVFNEEAKFIVFNAGDRPGVLEKVVVRLSINDASGQWLSFQSEHAISPGQTDIIKPGEQRSYQFLLTDRIIGVELSSDNPGFRRRLHEVHGRILEERGACSFSIVVRNFRSHRNWIDRPIRCYELVAYVNNYLVRIDKEMDLQRKKGAQP